MRIPVAVSPLMRRGRAPWVALIAIVGLSLTTHGLPPTALPAEHARLDTSAAFTLLESWPLVRAPAAPIDVALLPGGRLFVADGLRHAVISYDAFGRELGMWDHPPISRVVSHDYIPVALAADSDRDRIHVLWQRYIIGPKRVADGLLLDSRAPDGQQARGLIWLGDDGNELSDATVHLPSGDIWLLTDGRARRVRMPQGTVDLVLALAVADRDARALAVSPGGSLLVARPATGRIAVYAPDGAPAGEWPVDGGVPVALAADPSGETHVLVRALDPDDPRAPLIMTLGHDGEPRVTRAAAALQAPPLPTLNWPWAISTTYDGIAFSSAGERFHVLVAPTRGQRPPSLIGQRVTGPWAALPAQRTTGEVLMLSEAPDDSLVVLDGAEGRVVRVAGDGTSRLLGDAPAGAIDVAVGVDGEIYVSTRDGTLHRLAPGGSKTPTWSVACDCPLGGRITAGPGVVYASQPRSRSVAAFDPGTGLQLRHIKFPGPVSLWPSDLAVVGGTLYTADLVEATIQGWTSPGEPAVTWQAGLLGGPRRLAAGPALSGRAVVAAAMADGYVELHDLRSGNLTARWQPRHGDGSAIHAADIALSNEGLMFIADAHRRTVHVFGPGAGIPGTPDPAPAATPTPSDRSCTVEGNQTVWPSQLVAGADQTAHVSLSLRARCPDRTRVVGADIVLVLDRSLSMAGAPLDSARDAARAFGEMLDVRHHRLALASFSDDARLEVGLTADAGAVIEALDTLVPDGQTNIAEAIARARSNLQESGRPDALPVIVLLTDGQHNVEGHDPFAVAADARAWGVQLYVIGLGDGVDAAALAAIAGETSRLFLAPRPEQLFPIYREILRVVMDSLAGNFVVTDALPASLEYVSGSAFPPALVDSGRLRWGRSILPSTGITMTFQLRPLGLGCTPVSQHADAEYTDADGVRRSVALPIPTVCVVAPTATPTAEPTPTPAPIFLPMAMLDHCVPRRTGSDVVLVIDTSSSMAGDKLDQAKRAAITFLDELDLKRDRAAVIGFGSAPRIAAPLTHDAWFLRSAVRSLAPGSGTRIDRALWTAIGLLDDRDHISANRKAIVLLSDGAHAGPAGAVLMAADQAKQDGARMFTIALGADADRALLVAIADNGRSYVAASPSDLRAIYHELAAVIPCP